MKKIKIILIFTILFSFSCASSDYWKLRIEVPGKTSFNLDQYNEVVVTNFLIKEETKDFDLNQELVDYFSFEIGQNFNGKVSSEKIAFEKEEPFKNEAFWKIYCQPRKKLFFSPEALNTLKKSERPFCKKRKSVLKTPLFQKKGAWQSEDFTHLTLTSTLLMLKQERLCIRETLKNPKAIKTQNRQPPLPSLTLSRE